ncbi:hypothetical protein MMC27_003011 [Xylographa pallens]|nr:hypothetical protein [Xylographa pallens]
MLQRDGVESKRLDTQHELMLDLSSGHLIHPSIPSNLIRSVADVGTGTGVWLRDIATRSAVAKGKEALYVGFDISPQLFPSTETVLPDMNFNVHDITKPFPVKYHEAFDLVNIRCLSYAIRAVDLEKAGWHNQGGICNGKSVMQSTATINYVIAEKLARDLLPRIAAPLLKAIQSHTVALKDGQVNAITRSPELMRIINLETVCTRNHSSRAIARGKKAGILGAMVVLLQAGVIRRKALVENSSLHRSKVKKLAKGKQETAELIEAIKRSDPQFSDNWDMEMTWIVARKSIIVNEGEAWMSVKYPS